MHTPLLKTSFSAALLSAVLLPQLPTLASTYEALCGEVTCSISLDANGISGPTGFIPTGRIAQWFTGGETSYDVGQGTAGALGAGTLGPIGGGLLLGPIGLLGGLIGGGIAGARAGRSADLFFNVIGYDQSGKKTTLSFRFVNPKPANRLKTELPMFTGLAMGQTRSIEELKAALGIAPSPQALPEQLLSDSATESGNKKSSLPASIAAKSESRTAGVNMPTTGWNEYLKQRKLETWAKKNPRLAEQLRQRLFPSP